MIGVREQVCSYALKGFKGWSFPLSRSFIAQVFKVSHLTLWVAWNINQPVKAFTSPQSSQNIFMKSTSGWINDSHNFETLTRELFNYIWEEILSSSRIEVTFWGIYHSLIQAYILLCILNGWFYQFNSNYFLCFLAKANTYGTSSTANVKEDCVLINLCEILNKLKHLCEDICVNLEKGEWRHSEFVVDQLLLVVW